MTKAFMTIDPRMLQLLGSKLYTMPPLPICLRELLQNARDACLRKGIKPEIKITVEDVDGFTIVSCQDNGIGMTEEQILADFLCLGNQHSDDVQTVGGFGVAKAAFMRNPRWYVHTLDNEFDEKVLMDGEDIRKTDMLEGTLIKIWIQDYFSYSVCKDAIAMIMFSDVDITLNWFGQVIEHAGFHPTKPAALMEEAGEYSIYGTTENHVNTDFRDFEYEGMTAIRLSGLVQFLQDSYNDREILLIADIKPTVTPDDKSYAFNMSREKLRQDLNTRIWEFVNLCDTNMTSAKKNVIEIQTPSDDKLKMGKLTHGKRTGRRGDGNVVSNADSISFALPPSNVTTSQGEGVAMYFRGYHPDGRDVKKDSRFLRAWRELLEMTACEDDSFGIGLLDAGCRSASRIVKDGMTFYLIDPDFVEDTPNLWAKAMVLYDIAIHETTHFIVSSHTETFTQIMHEIQRETALIFLENHENLANLLG